MSARTHTPCVSLSRCACVCVKCEIQRVYDAKKSTQQRRQPHPAFNVNELLLTPSLLPKYHRKATVICFISPKHDCFCSVWVLVVRSVAVFFFLFCKCVYVCLFHSQIYLSILVVIHLIAVFIQTISTPFVHFRFYSEFFFLHV